MASLHCAPSSRRASYTPLFKSEKLWFCTEELGSESISNLSITNTSSCPPASVMADPHTRPQVLHRSLQEVNDKDNFNVSNTIRSRLHEEGALKETPMDMISKDEQPAIVCAGASQSANILSLQKYTKGPALSTGPRARRRAFPPPMASLLSNRQTMRTCKFNGRFVLQRISTMCNNPFCAIRENGRLKLIAVSSSSCGLVDDANTEEDAHDWQEDKQRESTILANKFSVGSCIKEGKVSSAFSFCVPRSMKLSTHHQYCLPALRLLLLVAGTAQHQHGTHSPRLINGIGKRIKPKGKLGKLYSDMKDSNLLLKSSCTQVQSACMCGLVMGSCTHVSSSSSSLSMEYGNSCYNSLILDESPCIEVESAITSSINEHNMIEKKAALEESQRIISMKLGLIILVLEVTTKGSLYLQGKLCVSSPSASSSFAFNTLKPLDLRTLEPTCH